MRWLLGLVVVAGCGGAKTPPAVERAAASKPATAEPPPTANPQPEKQRPEIDIARLRPDLHDDLRWPLSGMSHPSLEPRFPVAEQLAEPGITWDTLCSRGVHHRMASSQSELLKYLHGWCDVQKRDVDTAYAYLTPLLASATRGMASAVRQDLANILVDQGNADMAQHWIAKHNVRDPEILDLLAANYVEVGSPAEAFAINRLAIESDRHPSNATTCRRLVRQIALDLDTPTVQAEHELKQLATAPNVPDPTCVRLFHKLLCAQNWKRCRDYYVDEGISTSEQRLVDAYYTWPEPNAGLFAWVRYAAQTSHALPAAGAAELVIAALETAHWGSPDCTGAFATLTLTTIEELRKSATVNYEPRLQELAERCAQ